MGHLKDLKDSKLILNESKLFPWSSRICLVPFRTFRGPLFPKPVTGQRLFLAVSHSKLALSNSWRLCLILQILISSFVKRRNFVTDINAWLKNFSNKHEWMMYFLGHKSVIGAIQTYSIYKKWLPYFLEFVSRRLTLVFPQIHI